MSNLYDPDAPMRQMGYPIYNIDIRQGTTDSIVSITLTDSDGNVKSLDPKTFIGSAVVMKPTGREVSTSCQLEFQTNTDSESNVVFATIPASFTNGLNPYINRPVKVAYDIWRTDDGVTPTGAGVLGGVIFVRERITNNTQVGSGDVSTK